MRIALVVLLLAAFCRPLQAQVMLPDKAAGAGLRENVFGLGFTAGFAGGIGLSFRHHFPGSFSWQATGGVIKVDEKLMYSVGGDLQLDLARGGASRFFAALSAGYYYSAAKAHENTMAAPGRAGIGVGGEIPLGGEFHGTGELLFTWFSDGTVLPLPQASIHYYFH